MTTTEQKQSKPVDVVSPAPPATPLRTVAAPEAEGKAPDKSSVVVRPARMKARHYVAILSFVLMVLLPISGVFYYLYVHAADQYSSETSFSVRKEEASSGVSSLLGGLTSISGSTSDSDILYQFIQSHDLVEEIDKEYDLRTAFSANYGVDPVFSLDPEASSEDLLDFWNRMVTTRLEASSGILTVTTLSFSAQDSYAINEAILEKSRSLIERLSRISQEDTLRYAKEELETATERLKDARIQISTLRKTTRVIDPNADVESQMGVLNVLEQKLADALIELDLLADVTTSTDPRVQQAERKVKAIRNRIEEERAAIVSQDSDSGSRNNLYSALGTYEAMLVDQEFAEQAYVAALASYDGATAEARRKSRYLVAHIEPSLPETAQYPQRMVIGIVLSVFIFLSWVLLVLIGYSLRDRR